MPLHRKQPPVVDRVEHFDNPVRGPPCGAYAGADRTYRLMVNRVNASAGGCDGAGDTAVGLDSDFLVAIHNTQPPAEWS